MIYARQAITTKYLGPTDRRGSRVKATCQAGSVTLDWDDALDTVPNHARAAVALARKFGWGGEWAVGALPANGSAAYSFVDASETFSIRKGKVTP